MVVVPSPLHTTHDKTQKQNKSLPPSTFTFTTAAAITSESVSPRLNGPMLASVFSMQSFGQITGCVLVIILLAV